MLTLRPCVLWSYRVGVMIGGSKKFKLDQNGVAEDAAYNTFYLFIPAIMCSGCVTSLSEALGPYALKENKRNISINTANKIARIVVDPTISSNMLINVITDIGYGEPHPTVVTKHEWEQNSLPLQMAVPFTNQQGQPVTHYLKIVTARNDNCLDALAERLSNLQLNSQYNTSDNTVTVTAKDSVSLEQITAVVNALGHQVQVLQSAAPVSITKVLGRKRW